MLALRGELDVAHKDEIIIAGGLAEGAIEYLGRALVVALIEFVESLDHAARRVKQALAVGVLADIGEQRLHRLLGLGARRARLVGADGGGEEFARIKLRRAAVGLPVRGLVGADGFDDSGHVYSVRRPCGRSVTGRRGGEPPDA